MRIARIARPGALYGESAPSQSSEPIDETIINPRDFEEIRDVNISKVLETDSYSHMPRYGTSAGNPRMVRIVRIR